MGADDDDRANAATLRARGRAQASPALDATLPSVRPGDEPKDARDDRRDREAVDGLTLIGRFEIQRKLGEGGMGAVYLAADPTLGRRVAIKILHRDGGGDARADQRRLLREAQATAQLSHENVVVVHEVGTHDDHVYLAMEYVAGRTLKSWQEGRGWREILAMYRRAGLGLQAAHAAGLVHRDFKPDNVLVGDDGRVRVTDFGLVAANGDVDLGLSRDAATLRGTLDLALSMTGTGTVLGTPRYMAPEQHLGEPVDTRADQFAFCVALYEALYRQPPFAGQRYEVLMAHVVGGELTPVPGSSEVPTAVRDAVLRGLRRARDERFASMTELLAALEVVDVREAGTPPASPWRRRGPWLAVALVLVAAAAIVSSRYLRREASPGATSAAELACPAPALDPDQVWTAADAARLEAAGGHALARGLAREVERWREARREVCSGEATTRLVRSGCLDAVLARLDASARAYLEQARAPDSLTGVDLTLGLLTDPRLCLVPGSPHSPPTMTPAYREAVAAVLAPGVAMFRRDPLAATLITRTSWKLSHRVDAEERGRVAALLTRVTADPCASATVRLAWGMFDDDRPALDAELERCGDDRLRLLVLLAHARLVSAPGTPQSHIERQLAAAELAAKRLPSPESTALLARARMAYNLSSGRPSPAALDDAIEQGQIALDAWADRGAAAAQVEVATAMVPLRMSRSSGGDLAQLAPAIADLRARVVDDLGPEHEGLRVLDLLAAEWTFRSGDEDAAHRRFQELSRPSPNQPARRVAGRVIDAAGAPVAGATVFVDNIAMRGDSFGPANPASPSLRTARTEADGGFEIPDAPVEGFAVAEQGDRRSIARTLDGGLELRLEPTARLEGRVDLQGVPPATLAVEVSSLDGPPGNPYVVHAAVQSDGGFRIAGVPRRRVQLWLNDTQLTHQSRTLVVDRAVVSGITLATTPPRRLTVLVRAASETGAPFANATVAVLGGKHASGTWARNARAFRDASGEILLTMPIDDAQIRELRPVARPSDRVVTVTHAPRGPATACATSLPLTFNTRQLELPENQRRLEWRCQAIAADQGVVVIEVPPPPHLD